MHWRIEILTTVSSRLRNEHSLLLVMSEKYRRQPTKVSFHPPSAGQLQKRKLRAKACRACSLPIEDLLKTGRRNSANSFSRLGPAQFFENLLSGSTPSEQQDLQSLT